MTAIYSKFNEGSGIYFLGYVKGHYGKLLEWTRRNSIHVLTTRNSNLLLIMIRPFNTSQCSRGHLLLL